MKLIPSRNINEDINSAVFRLREQGILGISTDEYANIPMHASSARMIKQGIWIPLDEQYEEAILFLENPNYKVKIKLTEEQMAHIEKSAKDEFFTITSQFFSKVGKAIFYMALIGILLFMGFKVANA